MSTLVRKVNVRLPADIGEGPVSFTAYQNAVRGTDKLDPDDIGTPIMGLFGEIGSLLAALKKKRRDPLAFAAYEAVITEELGDALWYATAVLRRARLELANQIRGALRSSEEWEHNEPAAGTFAEFAPKKISGEIDLKGSMAELADHVGELVRHERTGKLVNNPDAVAGDIVAILRALFATARSARIDISRAVRGNLEKIFSRYPLDRTYETRIDTQLGWYERLPDTMEIYFEEVSVGEKRYVFQRWNGVVIGDRLTDNKKEQDDYRFHDVFHVAYAVHLGWSPVLRSLLRLKRKSMPSTDENEDGARAVLIEEGITTFIFGKALERNLFEGLERIDNDLLKLIQDFVRGFEPDCCALWQ